MSKFTYIRPESLDEAFKLMAEHPGYSLLAGGTDFMVKLKEKIVQPRFVIDLGALRELTGITMESGKIRLGALTSHTQVCESDIIIKHAPALAEAAGLVGSPQIRNKGTIGGNMGNASPAADTVPALIAYGAEITIAGKDGTRTIPLEDLFAGPGRTFLKPGEVIIEVSFEGQKSNQGCGFGKLGKRKALAISVVNAAAFIEINPETKAVAKAKITLGSVAPTPIRVHAAEELLEGRELAQDLIASAASAVSASIKPIDDVRSTAVYRKEVAGTLVKRALEVAWNQIDLVRG